MLTLPPLLSAHNSRIGKGMPANPKVPLCRSLSNIINLPSPSGPPHAHIIQTLLPPIIISLSRQQNAENASFLPWALPLHIIDPFNAVIFIFNNSLKIYLF